MDISWPPLINILGVPDVGIKVRVRIPVLNISHVSTVIYLTPEQVLQLATPTYKIRKEKQKSKDVLVDSASVTVVSPVEQEVTEHPASHNSSVDFSLPTPSFRFSVAVGRPMKDMNYRTRQTRSDSINLILSVKVCQRSSVGLTLPSFRFELVTYEVENLFGSKF